MRIILSSLCLLFCLISCEEGKSVMPKQRMFPFVDYPERHDTILDKHFCNFTFSYPGYFSFRQDSFYFGEKPAHDCWFDLNAQGLGASLHCSYYPIQNRTGFDKLVNDAFEITGKHNIKANARKETLIENGHNASGIMFEVSGPVASPIQFYLTDSTRHFFRASLYFNATVNPDSTAPVLQFIKADLDRIITGFTWKEK
ncbi:MAG: hypothetical protein IPN29_14800 [Saprospiraceae bacterium]|nr:hypothetical protein [Saprospiraceae bacterium]